MFRKKVRYYVKDSLLDVSIRKLGEVMSVWDGDTQGHHDQPTGKKRAFNRLTPLPVGLGFSVRNSARKNNR